MALPFTVEQFLGVFVRYNEAIWPAQLVAYLLGAAAVALAFRPTTWSHRAISAILGLFWLFAGAVYHLTFFRAINPIAAVFGAAFVVQGLLLLWVGAVRGRLVFAPGRTVATAIGALFVLYAMVLYPAIGMALGHGYPSAPVFGVAPCPLTIFTLGLLLWADADGRLPKGLLVVPVLWSLLGVSAALQLGIREDLGLLVASVTTVVVLLGRRLGRRLGAPAFTPSHA
jgi:hypothetical protein